MELPPISSPHMETNGNTNGINRSMPPSPLDSANAVMIPSEAEGGEEQSSDDAFRGLYKSEDESTTGRDAPSAPPMPTDALSRGLHRVMTQDAYFVPRDDGDTVPGDLDVAKQRARDLLARTQVRCSFRHTQ